MWTVLVAVCLGGVQWQHPAGMITEETLSEVGAKLDTQEWARQVWEGKKKALAPWIDTPFDTLQARFPKRCGNVYHNFSCPEDRCRLDFDPLEDRTFRCPQCGKTYPAETDPGVYRPEERYHGTMYDGWACLYYLEACQAATELAVMGHVEGNEAYLDRARDLLLLFAATLEGLAVDDHPDPQFRKLLTYHREGDNKILFELAQTYELVRGRCSEAERTRLARGLLERMLDEIMLEPIYTYDHNNVYQWHRTIVQTALALEREEVIDWSFGRGGFSPEVMPAHRSMARILATHFLPDGAFWELCSGYHLYPMYHLCEFAVLSHHLSRMDPERFPAAAYDLTGTESAGGRTIFNALHWFLSMAMPNRRMPTVADSTLCEAGMDDYQATAEVGYRFFGVKEVGDYASLREGKRSWLALLHGAPEIVQTETPFETAYLSSGWVSLRQEWAGNLLWAGLNAMIAGGGHQHADRLTLLLYNQGKKLLLEKATPYNEKVTRVLGTLTPMHSTVTVDGASQPQGEDLTPEQTPRVTAVFDGSWFQCAQLDGEGLYPQTEVYRRTVVLLEDVAVDCFEVRGGKQLDWMAYHAGPAPKVSLDMAPAEFIPAEWLYHGSDEVFRGETDGPWEARWQVGGVTSRLTLAGGPGTQAFVLETYPIENAVVTENDPPCPALCVRRAGDSVFLAVWDAWKDAPNVQSVTGASRMGAVTVRTQAHTYHLAFGEGEARFEDGTSLVGDGSVTILRDRDAVAMVNGTSARVRAENGAVEIRSARRGNVCLAAGKRSCGAPVSITTVGGANTLYPLESEWQVSKAEGVFSGLRQE